ncbi:adenylosuccinate lyase [uncultured Kriegella sp.]|uniref:adenylosuccinate lyase n=1 Tax=uncultured Kriegella sp. TaxID=1798910 RepID=UPI0030D84D04|tara:strand:+ start:435996 stop:436490 length:495 start_codon:yes stop_codon:yes gene_type:complete
MAEIILQNPELISPLIKIAFDVNDPISSRACWVMEFTAKQNLSYIYPHLDYFTSNLKSVHLDSSVRPVAKICEYLISAYFLKADPAVQKVLNQTFLARIATACFDWLIGEHKVAAQAYSMTCLLLLGRKIHWIHEELKLVLEQNYANGSAAYKARARMTLAQLK